MFETALIVALVGFLPKRLFQAGTAQGRGFGTVPAATDGGWPPGAPSSSPT